MFVKRTLLRYACMLGCVTLLVGGVTIAATQPLTEEEREALRRANYGVDAAMIRGTSVEKTILASLKAKEYLMGKLVGGAKERGRSSVYGDEHSSGLHPLFACRLALFIKEAESNGYNIQITSGYRSAALQMRLTGRVCECSSIQQCLQKCPHVRGIAADLLFDGRGQVEEHQCGSVPACKWADSRAEQFGLVRLRPQSGCHAEPWHFELRGAGDCGTRSDVGGSIDPRVNEVCGADNKVYPPSSGYNPSTAPSSGISSAVRNWFAPPQQVNQAVVAQPAKASQPVSASQNPLAAFAEPAPLPSISGQINATTGNASGSPADRLEDLAFPKRPATSTATSVPIVVTASEAAALSSTQTTALISTTSIQGIVSLGQSTFVSPDLSWSQGQTALSQPVTGWQATIANIKAILVRILAILTPFARQDAHLHEEAVE